MKRKVSNYFCYCPPLLKQPREAPLNDVETNREEPANNFARDFYVDGAGSKDHEDDGVVTGNWGCGVFGGDPELKAMIQWLAASQVPIPS